MDRRQTKVAISTILGISLLGALVAYVGVGEILAALRRADPRFVGLAFLAYALFFVVRGWRWSHLLSPIRPGIPVRETSLLMAVSWLVNTYVPMKAGDVARAAMMHRRQRIGFMESASTVAVERALDLAGLAILSSLGLLLIPKGMSLPPVFERALQVTWILPLVLLGVMAWVARRRDGFMEGMERVLFWVPAGLRRRLMGLAESFLTGCAALARTPRLLAWVVPLTMVQTLLQASVFVFLFLAFEPGAPWVLLLAGAPFFLMSFIVAFTPGNVGTYEAAFTAVFTALGLPAATVIPVAVLTHVSTTLFVTVLGALAIPLLGMRPAALRTADETQAATGVES